MGPRHGSAPEVVSIDARSPPRRYWDEVVSLARHPITARAWLLSFLLLPIFPDVARAAPVMQTYWYASTITSGPTGPIALRAELNYDNARSNAPIAVVMHGYSPTNGNLDSVRPHAQRLRDQGFFAISVAMRGRDGSAGLRDSGGLEIHDVYDAVEAVKNEFPTLVDPTNVHITGYSGGGGNVMSAITKFPDYFRLGSSFFGMSDYGYDPVEGWYNNGAGGRTSILDQDVGNANLGLPAVLDRYLARASNLAASNSRAVEVHLFVNDNETICPPVNHLSFATYGGAHVTHHIGLSASPQYEDFNGNGVEDFGERQLWPHGFPSASEQEAAERWYRDRLVAGEIPEPELPLTGTLVVPGFLVTRAFEVWPGDGQEAAGVVAYELSDMAARFELLVISSDTSVPIDLVVESAFLEPAGSSVVVYRNGLPIDTFTAGDRRVLRDLAHADLIELAVTATPVPTSGPIALVLVLLAAHALAYRARAPGRR